MGRSVDILAMVIILGGLAAWVVWGYLSWACNRSAVSKMALCSLAGFTLASLSALVEISSGIYAQFHEFRYYDPLLMTIYRVGFFVAGFGFVVSLFGSATKSPLRWKALVLSAVMLLLWSWHAVSE